MVFFALWKPSREDERRVIVESSGKPLNYSLSGATRDADQLQKLGKNGWLIDTVSVKVGKGERAFRAATSFLQRWGHFQLGWAGVDPSTSTREGAPVVVTSKTLFLWSCNPLRIVYSDLQEPARPRFHLPWQPRPPRPRSFHFAHGCLQGHMFTGEESFKVEMRPDGTVWYDIVTFSKPIHPLAVAFYPLTRYFQWRFRTESAQAVEAAVAAEGTSSSSGAK